MHYIIFRIVPNQLWQPCEQHEHSFCIKKIHCLCLYCNTEGTSNNDSDGDTASAVAGDNHEKSQMRISIIITCYVIKIHFFFNFPALHYFGYYGFF